MVFRPGQSGNPGGRPKENERVKALAREHTEAAIQALVDALSSPKERVAAATALLDRAYGRPTQAVDLTHDASEAFAKLWGIVSAGTATALADGVAQEPEQSASVRH